MSIVQGIPGISVAQSDVEEIDFPRVPTDLLEALEQRFPNQCPDLRISQLDFGVVHGQLSVVRLLREMHGRPSIITKKED